MTTTSQRQPPKLTTLLQQTWTASAEKLTSSLSEVDNPPRRAYLKQPSLDSLGYSRAAAELLTHTAAQEPSLTHGTSRSHNPAKIPA